MSTIRKELGALYIIQVANFAIPLITMPYLTYVLGINNFGKIAYFNALLGLMGFFIDFGFGMSASKSIAIAKKEDLSRIYSNVQFIRIIIFMITNFVFYIYCRIVGNLDFSFYLLVIATLGVVFTPSWLFVGLSKNFILAKITLISKLLLLFFIILLIQNRIDYVKVIFLYAISNIIIGIFSTYTVSNSLNVKYDIKKIDLSVVKTEIKSSTEIFWASFFTLGHTYLTPIILKHFVNDAAVGIYSILEKILMLLRQIYGPITVVFYPKICQYFVNNEKYIVKKINIRVLMIFLAIGISAWLSNFFVGNSVLELIFPNLGEALRNFLNIGIAIQIVISIAMILVNFIIIPSGQTSVLKYLYFIGFCLYALCIYFLRDNLKLGTVLYLILFLEVLLTLSFYVFIRYRKILN